jgi:hypothetical protein
LSHAPAAQDATSATTSTSTKTGTNAKNFSRAANDGYALIVDGHVKSEFKTKEGAEKGARELKRRFPMLQIKVYDAEAKRNEEVALLPRCQDDWHSLPQWTYSRAVMAERPHVGGNGV